MQALLHLLSLVLALPGVGLAAAFLILGRGIAFLGVLLDTAAWLLPWGLLACFLALIALAIGGCTVRFRWLASLCVAILAIGSSVVVLTLTAVNFSPDRLLFFLPAFISAALSIWIAVHEWPRHGAAYHLASPSGGAD